VSFRCDDRRYCEFNDIIEAIAKLDADVTSVESSRSEMELLDAFRAFKHPSEVGPGIWDIHSTPRTIDRRNHQPAGESTSSLAQEANLGEPRLRT
jgi:hypothetical protein